MKTTKGYKLISTIPIVLLVFTGMLTNAFSQDAITTSRSTLHAVKKKTPPPAAQIEVQQLKALVQEQQQQINQQGQQVDQLRSQLQQVLDATQQANTAAQKVQTSAEEAQRTAKQAQQSATEAQRVAEQASSNAVDAKAALGLVRTDTQNEEKQISITHTGSNSAGSPTHPRVLRMSGIRC